ncbi:MAG: alpha/beta hydrolase [Xanthomonadales bacterium]|nr:alpha/beta hydrolase [Xanthomonadales bacterium]
MLMAWVNLKEVRLVSVVTPVSDVLPFSDCNLMSQHSSSSDTLSDTAQSTQSSLRTEQKGVVVLVHGLWYRAAGMKLLASRLRRRGYRVVSFDYPSVFGQISEQTQALRRCIEREQCPVFLVGHSMGGLLILRALNEFTQLQVPRAVLLGSPVRGSGVARRLAKRWWSQWIVGANADLLGQGARAPKSTQVGVLAGNRNVGVGRVLGGVGGHGDGTVSVGETRLAGAQDEIILPVTHTGMVMSAMVARQVDAFLQQGCFHDETMVQTTE